MPYVSTCFWVISCLKKYNIKKAYVFGSYARGEATEKSDIDIMIKTTDSDILSLLNLSNLEIEAVLNR